MSDPRADARAEILKAANRIRSAGPAAPQGPYLMKHLQLAVCVVRQNRAVPAKTLEVAGFRAERAR